MAQIYIKDISSIMVMTGANALNNALALENREYGYEDEHIGKLTKTSSNDSAFNKVPKEIFVETTPKYNGVTDLTELAYSYIIDKSVNKPVNEMYLNNDVTINFKYNYETDFESNINNGKTIPFADSHLYLASLNNAMYNKQRFYSRFNEIEYITYNGVKYYWNKPGFMLEESYIGVTHEIGNDYCAYEMNVHEVQKTIWDEKLQSYVLAYNEIVDKDTNEITYEPIMENKYSLKYLYTIKDIINNKLSENVERYKNIYEKDNFCAYYLYNLNNKISFVANTYSFGKQNFDIFLNYDGEFNNWFNNRISFNLKGLESTENVKLANIVLGDDYWTNATINENVFVCGESQKYDKDTNIELTANFVTNDIENISLLAPHKIKKLDLSNIAQYLDGDLNLLNEYDKKIDYVNTVKTDWNKEKSNMLEELIIGKESINCNITNIIGLNDMNNLKKLDIIGCNKLQNLDLSYLTNLSDFNGSGTIMKVFQPAQNTQFNNITLPETIESLILNNVKFESLNYNPNDNLTALELSNVEGIDTYEFICNWIEILKNNGKLNSGIIDHVNLNGITWNNVSLDTLLDLKKIELNQFTGTVNIVGSLSDYISRVDYRLLHGLYGAEVFNEDNELKFNVNLDENAFKVLLTFNEEKIELIEGVESKTYEEIENVEIDILDTNSGNSLLNDMQFNQDLYNNLHIDNFINNNRKNIGIYTTLTGGIEYNLSTEKLDQINIGDILLYKNQLIIASKNSENINMHFIKLGNIKDFGELSTILNNMTDINNIVITLKTLEIDHNISE